MGLRTILSYPVSFGRRAKWRRVGLKTPTSLRKTSIHGYAMLYISGCVEVKRGLRKFDLKKSKKKLEAAASMQGEPDRPAQSWGAGRSRDRVAGHPEPSRCAPGACRRHRP